MHRYQMQVSMTIYYFQNCEKITLIDFYIHKSFSHFRIFFLYYIIRKNITKKVLKDFSLILDFKRVMIKHFLG